MKKKYLVTVASLLALFSLTACGTTAKDTQDKVKDKGTLVVALSPDYAPFEFQTLKDGKNTIVGSDIMLAQDIADQLGVKLKLSPMSFNNVLSSLQSKKQTLLFLGFHTLKNVRKFMIFQNHITIRKMPLWLRKVMLLS